MRIAFVSLMGGATWGGSEELWSKTAAYAISQRHEIFVSVYNWGDLPLKIKDLQQSGAKIHLRSRFNAQNNIFEKTWLHIKNRIDWLNNAYMPIIRWKPDYIIINQGETFDIAVHHYKFYELIRMSNISYALICHSHLQYSEIPTKEIYPGAKPIFGNAHKVFFVSKRMQAMAERKLCMQLDNAYFTWNPINIKNPVYNVWPLEKKVNFAMVGYLGNNKGHDTLFEVLSHPQWQERNWHLNLYGNGYGKDYLLDLATFFGISSKITFHGHIDSMDDVWKLNHLLLIPSTTEGIPLSLVEAMMSGRPAVVTDVGGIIEIITEEKTGFIAEAPSVSSFSKALEKAWTFKDTWKKMGMNAHEFCNKNVDLNPEMELMSKISS